MIKSTNEDHLLPLTSKQVSDPEPIGEIIRRSRSAQAALGISIALAVGNAWFRFDSELLLPPILSVFVAVALIVGGGIVWIVKYLANSFPLAAIVAEKSAIAAIFVAYFAVANAFLGGMSGIAALPWICLIVCFVLVNVRLPHSKLNSDIILS